MGTNIEKAAVYYRLSSEDGNKEESESISNQRNIIADFCKHRGIVIVREFWDDGYSGANFDRPGFQQLLSFVESGAVNTVVTKDLSRLGREMSICSYYAETFFPEHDIHFLTASGDFDSEHPNVMVPFQFAMNDVYLRDTSKKIKDVFREKHAKGDYCACPPFGYKKSTENKDVLVPDPATAPIVQHIFSLAAEGISAHRIATTLTAENCITPLLYRVLYRDDFTEKGAAKATSKWNQSTVSRILQNEVYLGHTILGKTKKISVKSKKKKALPKEEWKITRDTHEPLVSVELFEVANRNLNMHTKAWETHPHTRKSIFNGLIFCKSCGGALCSSGSVYKGERDKYWYLACTNIPKRREEKQCLHGARIKYDDLVEIVLNELNTLLSLTDEEIAAITKEAMRKVNFENPAEKIASEKKRIEKRLGNIDAIIAKLYEDNVSGMIDDARLVRMVGELTKESDELVQQQKRYHEMSDLAKKTKDAYETFFAITKQYTHIETLTSEIVRTFIKRIEIGEKILPDGYQVASHNVPHKQTISIEFRFIGNISENDEHCWHTDETAEIS